MSDEKAPPGLVSGGGKKSKRGGLRSPPGGRPRGSTNALPLGAVSAVKTAKLRVPEGTPEEHADLAEEAKDRIVDVMRERVHWQNASQVLKAATRVRDEICGPIAHKQEISGPNGEPIRLIVDMDGDDA